MIKLYKAITSKNHVTLIQDVLAENKWLSVKARFGHEKSMRKLIGLGMKEYKGKIHPNQVRDLINHFIK